MAISFALGGPSRLGREWHGYLYEQLDTVLDGDASFTFASQSLDVQELSPMDIVSDEAPDSPVEWSQEKATEQVTSIFQSDADLYLLETPDLPNDYMDTLLDPVTHMCIFAPTKNDQKFDDWGEVAAKNDVDVTHHVITAEGGSTLYDRSDDGTTKIYPLTIFTGFESGDWTWMKRSEAVELLVDDLIDLVIRLG